MISLLIGRSGLWLALGLTIVGAGTMVWREHDTRLRAEGRALERSRVADSVIGKLRLYERGLAGTVERDTTVLTKVVHTQTLVHDTLLRELHDTTIVRDTLVRTVLQYVHVTDSTIATCRQGLTDCVQLAENRRQQIEQFQLKLQTQVTPSCTLGHVVWGGIGVGAGFLLGRK